MVKSVGSGKINKIDRIKKNCVIFFISIVNIDGARTKLFIFVLGKEQKENKRSGERTKRIKRICML